MSRDSVNEFKKRVLQDKLNAVREKTMKIHIRFGQRMDANFKKYEETLGAYYDEDRDLCDQLRALDDAEKQK